MTKLLFVSILALLLTGFHGASLQAQDAMPGSGTGMKDMTPQMETDEASDGADEGTDGADAHAVACRFGL